MIPRPFFDRPVGKDPLFWVGIVGGLTLSVIAQVLQDASAGEFVWGLFQGMFFFTWWVAGLVLSTIRYQIRRRRAAKELEDPVATE